MNLNITTILIIANVAASFYAWNKPEIMSKWLMNPYQINRKNEYFRFISSGFIHADYMHLFFNMFTLYSFGAYLESAYQYQYGQQVGGLLYLILFLVGIIVSDMPSYFKHKDDYNYNSLGASGGVSAIIYACILLNPWSELYIYFIPVKGIFFAILYSVYSIWMNKKGYDNINHSAHLYGGIFWNSIFDFVLPKCIYWFYKSDFELERVFVNVCNYDRGVPHRVCNFVVANHLKYRPYFSPSIIFFQILK